MIFGQAFHRAAVRLACAGLSCWLACGPAAANKTQPAPPPRPASPPPAQNRPVMRAPQMSRPMASPMPMPLSRPAPVRPLASVPLTRPATRQPQPTRASSATRPVSPAVQRREASQPARPAPMAAHRVGPAEAGRVPGQPAAIPGHTGLAPMPHGSPNQLAGGAARPQARPDMRIGGTVTHTHGVAEGLRIARALPPRPFLRPALHRDVAGEHAFLASHAAHFHTRLVRDFNRHELAAWRAGLWRNEWHYGRRGWWWEADGAWYPYPQPLLPFPVEVVEPVVSDVPVVDGPDLSAQEGVAEAAPAPDALPPGDAASAPPPADAAGSPPPAGGQEVAAQVAAATPDIPPLPPAPVGWYRCYAPSGVYPGVQSCGMGWTLVQDAPLPGEL